MSALEHIIYWLADFMWGSWMTVLMKPEKVSFETLEKK